MLQINLDTLYFLGRVLYFNLDRQYWTGRWCPSTGQVPIFVRSTTPISAVPAAMPKAGKQARAGYDIALVDTDLEQIDDNILKVDFTEL